MLIKSLIPGFLNPQAATRQLGPEASEWVLRLVDTDPEPEDPYFDPAKRKAAFLEWLDRSPEHLAMFIETVKAYQTMKGIDPSRLINIPGLLTELSAERLRPSPSGGVVRRAVTQYLRHSTMAWRRAVPIIAVIVVLLLLLFACTKAGDRSPTQTATPERASSALSAER
jgi:ferric-dicitrate binding protein FerR (iron transport regulator)